MTPLAHRKLLETLTRHQVPFVIIGGHAVNYHGHQRGTQDVDAIWIRRGDSEVALVNALREMNACWVSDETDPGTGLEKLVPVSPNYVASTHLMMLVTDHGFLDLFDFVPGIPDADPQHVLNDSVPFKEFRYVSLDWLRRMKRATDRASDAEDLRHLGE